MNLPAANPVNARANTIANDTKAEAIPKSLAVSK
jgi:hypothetical protein